MRIGCIFRRPLRILAGAVFQIALIGVGAQAETIEPPRAADLSVRVSLFASEPDIVTPIGATVDATGRLLVVESQSHFRPKNYQGPLTDRIRMLEPASGSEKAERITTFFEGQNFLMNVLAEKDGGVLVSSRSEIFRLLPRSGGGSPAKISLVHLETKINYPHNGLHGLASDGKGSIYIGIGENFGGAWTLVGADGQKISDDRGSGSIFRINHDGGELKRVAQGFWNPFGLGIDPAGTLWAVDNDADGRPPCRLIQVQPGAEYGFEFRFGRNGLHPLQSWDAELPGTLGMVAGVGEAPCAVLWNRGRLLVSSWRDHQVQAYTLIPHGASYTATMTPLLSGGENFRPVALAAAPDGSLFVTDWASSSYPIHGKGRIWKITFPDTATSEAELKPTEAMERAANLRQSSDVPMLIAAMDDADPAMAQAAQYGLSRLEQTEKIQWSSLFTPRQRIGLLASLLWRGTSVEPHIAPALQDPDESVREMGVRCVSEQLIQSAKGDLQRMLQSQSLSPRLLGMTIATLNQLGGDRSARVDSASIDGILLSRLAASDATDQSKAVALHMLQAGHPPIGLDRVEALLKTTFQPLQLEAVRYLNADLAAGRFAVLARVAADQRFPSAIRAEAVDGLSDDAAEQSDFLFELAEGSDAALRDEALRALRKLGTQLNPAQKQRLVAVASRHPEEAQLVNRVFGKLVSGRPSETDLPAWQNIVEQKPGDPEAGLRLFFHPAGPGCYRCHMIDGRGRAIGPDLTMIGHSQTREHVLESILQPSKEIAPLFTLWTITTRSGQRIDGMLLRRDGQQTEVYVDSGGQETKVQEPDVVDRKIRRESLMPAGLTDGMTDQELRDLLAMLMQKR